MDDDQISRRIKLRHLRAFIAVAKSGSMVSAAEQLAVSQPVVSKAIAELEELVGVSLFDRLAHGVTPTLYGRALLNRSSAVIDDVKTIVSELRFLADPARGELRIGCEENLATGLLPTLVDRLSRQYPGLVFELAIGDPPTLQRRDLLGRKVELAIMRSEVHELDEGLEQTLLYEDRMWVVAGANSPWAMRRKIRLADLVQERWCLPPPEHPVGKLVVKAFGQIGLPPPPRTVTVASAQCTSNLVAHGYYLGVLGSMFLQFNPPSVQLKVLPVAFPVAAPPISIVTVKHRALSPVAKMFVEFVRKVANPASKTRATRGSGATRPNPRTRY
jgi:DNA-binding transcriptional LysR family regulator